jgi:hypothetical protein
MRVLVLLILKVLHSRLVMRLWSGSLGSSRLFGLDLLGPL